MTMPVFQQLQRQFLNYLRHPTNENQPAGFAEDRLAVYNELLYNKFDESLSACFPVLCSILEETRWRALLKDFIAEHRCLTPYYRKIPDEFVLYLQSERSASDDLPFLAELAHFEWMELVLSLAEAEPVIYETLDAKQLLHNVPVFTPVAQLLHYLWPVQEINRNYQPEIKPASTTHILGFRDAEGQVQFITLSAATAGLFLSLENRNTAIQVLQDMGKGLKPDDQANLLKFGTDILLELHRQGAIIGICRH